MICHRCGLAIHQINVPTVDGIGTRFSHIDVEASITAKGPHAPLIDPGMFQQAVDLLADMVVKCTEYGSQDGGFVANYIMPTGPVHRAIPWLQQHGVTVRPGFDGRSS